MVLNFSDTGKEKQEVTDLDSLAQLSKQKLKSEEPGSATARLITAQPE
jgi:hypothetical protein